MKIKILLNPNGAMGNGSAAIQTPDRLDAMIGQIFPEGVRNNQPQPSGDGAGGTTDLFKMLGDGGGDPNPAPNPNPDPDPDPNPAPNPDPEPDPNPNPDPDPDPNPNPDPGAGEQAVTMQELVGFQKRIGGLLRRIENQESELEDLRRGQGVNGNGSALPVEIANVYRVDDLREMLERDEAGLAEVEALVPQIAYDAEGVAARIRELTAGNPEIVQFFKKPGEEGQGLVDDYSPAKMARFLHQSAARLKNNIKAIPKRQGFLQHQANVRGLLRQPEVLAVAPFVTNIDSDEHLSFRDLASKAKAFENGELLAAAAQIGLRTLLPAIQKAGARMTNGRVNANGGNGNGGNGNGQRRTNLPGTHQAGSGGGARGGKLAQARTAFEQKPTKSNLAKWLEAV